MKKAFALIILTIILAIGSWYLYNKFTQDHYQENQDEWTTYSKENKVIKSHPSTDQELHKIGASSNDQSQENHNNNNKRTTASIKDAPGITLHQGRQIIGQVELFKESKEKIQFVNQAKENWKDKLSEKLLKHRERKAKLFIKGEKQVLKIYNGTARYLELVRVTFLFEGDDKNSFKAFVDSETGEVVQTWSRTIHERVGSQPPTLTPSGTL